MGLKVAPRRLSQKLILSLTAVVAAVAAISGLVNVQVQEREMLRSIIAGSDQLSKSIVSSTWHAMLADKREDAYQSMSMVARGQGIQRIRLFNRAGELTYATDGAHSGAPCATCHEGPERRVIPGNSFVSVNRTARGRVLDKVTPIFNEPACSNAACHAHPASQKVIGVLDLALDVSSVDRQIHDMQMRVLFTTIIEIVLVSIVIFVFTRHFVSRPIGKLTRGARNVSAMKLETPIEIVESSQELEQLSRSFEEMRERLSVAMKESAEFTQRLEVKVQERTDQLKAAHQKLMTGDRLASLGQLAASVAHEINNPISGVLNLSMLLQRILKDDGVPPERMADFRKYLTQITSETTRVGRIVSDLLSFSRRSKPQRSPVDLNGVVRQTVSLVAHKMRLANTEIELDLIPDLPLIECDRSQMQQVLLNLVLNASEATQTHGSGHVHISTVVDGEKNGVTLTVRDDGEGIRPEHLAKIFDPFFTTKPEGKGVGLGLAVLYGIVQAHDGDVDVKSKLGQGTEFIVSMPLHSAGQPVPRPQVEAVGPVA
ncbi:MAG TPA: ATP-binding protein [Bryobacteraceae bacterium]|nr:ATP-binding protein [Bryobacteraceae bacterium]